MRTTIKGTLLTFCLFALSAIMAAQVNIPAGTVIPVTLNTSLDTRNSTVGEAVSAKVAQNVPLYNGQVVKAGTLVMGAVLAVIPASSSQPSAIVLRFSQLEVGGASVPVIAHLRALASPEEVRAAQESTSAQDRGSEPSWEQTTVQIGGDVVYRGGGPVAHGIQTVGTPVNDGVLSRVSANAEGPCRAQSRATTILRRSGCFHPTLAACTDMTFRLLLLERLLRTE